MCPSNRSEPIGAGSVMSRFSASSIRRDMFPIMYKVKYSTDSFVNRYKGRIVAKGYAQKHGIDYDETFAPIAKMTTVRVLLAIAVAKG